MTESNRLILTRKELEKWLGLRGQSAAKPEHLKGFRKVQRLGLDERIKAPRAPDTKR